jgi:5-methylthioribose kinase
MGAFFAEKIQFQLIGMSAAVLQGVPVATLDVDMWLNLPARRYMRAMNIALDQGAKLARNTVAELADGTLVNFIFEVTGLKDFATELANARKLKFHGLTIPVMPLESIRKSKAAIRRPKDAPHIFYIDETLRASRANRRGK